MREILFKAKRKDNDEWVEGYYVPHIVEGKIVHHFILTGEADLVETEDDELILKFYWEEIDPDTICQYTGFTDKNGKKIWENDILRGHGNDSDLAKVVFGEFKVIDVETLEAVESCVGWHTEVIETDALSKCEPFCLPMPLTEFYISRSEFEVVGNIFDNVDLLEAE